MKKLMLIFCAFYTISMVKAQNFESQIKDLKQFEQERNIKEILKITKGLLNNKEVSYGLLSWNYNNIIGLDPNSIVFTQGDNDTYPLWILQYAKNIRQDVLVLNLQMITNEAYRNKLFQENNIPICEANEVEVILNHLINKQDKRSIYISSSVANEFREAIAKDLYPTGLPFKYSNTKFDNLKVIQKNYEENYLLDYLKTNIFASTSNELVHLSNLNYIPSFILLEEHYNDIGEEDEASQLNLLIRNIAESGGRAEDLNQYYTKNDKKINYYRELPFLDFQKNLQKLEDGLYVHSLELTNKWYNYFLEDLLHQKEYELLKNYGAAKVDWYSYLDEEEKKLDDKKIFERGYPSDDDLPVVNISPEAANAFCVWLTDRYNIWSHNKKEYNKVTYRLPTIKEWQSAASSNDTKVENYPWENIATKDKVSIKGPKNAKGCYLGNFYSNKAEPCKDCPVFEMNPNSQDGGFFTVRSDSYWPNKLGLYNMSGNVAEMTTEKVAMGGSWYNVPEESTINNQQESTEGKPWIGFRIFMTINE